MMSFWFLPQSSVLPSTADTRTQVTRSIALNIPLAQLGHGYRDRSRMAICMAQAGGMGVIHRNLNVEEQASEVRRVKRFERASSIIRSH